ncbi:MAG: lipid hydroperoxide peroxidase [Planctomycetes bacterium GWF2_50_10]|nr:MAG: lipid hydroperoxide peroxidase [Planctomycetes bacterium GWF2_50_10]
MTEHKGAATFKGNPLTLLGDMPKVGDLAPDAELTGNDLSKIKISDYRGKIVVLSAVPSLDTPVCATETRRFNEAAAKMGDDVVILTVSMDLPFAQARWCGAEGIDKVVTASDHKAAAMGEAYGVLIKELRLLARTVFVIDKDGVIRYIQPVKEISSEPDYGAVGAAVKALK